MILTDYSAPFNHMLYTCLLRLWVDVVGRGDAEVLLRLPSVAFGLGAVATLLFGLRKPSGPLSEPASWLAAALLAGSPSFLLFAWQIRGYCLSMLLGAAMLAFYFRREKRGAGSGYALCGAASIAVMPTNRLLVAGLGVAHVLSTRPRRLRLSPLLWLAAPLAGFLAYAAVFAGLFAAATTSDWAGSLGHSAFLAGEAAGSFAFAAWLAPFAVLGFTARGKRDAATRPAFVLTALAAPFVLIALSRTVPYSRNLLVIPPGLVRRPRRLRLERGLVRAFPQLDAAKTAGAAACLALGLSSGWVESRALAFDPASKPQDLSRAYYDTCAFRPDLAVAFAKERKKLGRSAAIADDADLLSLVYYARTTNGGPVFFSGHLKPSDYRTLRSRGDVLLIARDQRGADGILETLKAAGKAERLRSFGFFSVYEGPVSPTDALRR